MMPMPQALAGRIAFVRRRARVTLFASGAAVLVAVLGGLVVLAALVDRVFHVDEPAIRLSFLIGIGAAGLVVAWRFLIAPLIFRMSDTAIALRIERRFPQLEERLASSVQFASSGRDARLGSPDLQQRVIGEALDRAEAVDLREVVRKSAAWPAVTAAGCVLLVVIGLAGVWPGDAALAARRLFVPFSAPPWPRKTDLRLLSVDFQPIEPRRDSPIKVVRGRKLELLVEDRHGRLPDNVSLEYRLEGEAPLRETLRHVSLRDRSGAMRDVCLVSLPADRGPIWFRASGGDDKTMPEIEMRVVLPPELESLQLTVTPPPYTSKASQALPPGDGRLRGVLGTHVSYRARSSQPLAAATLQIKGKPAGTLTLSNGARDFHGTFALTEPGTYPYSLLMKNVEGIDRADPPQYEIAAVADAVPEVSIDEPVADSTVTANAEIPVTVSAKDDLGLRDVRLRFNVGETADVHSTAIPLAADLPRPEHHRVTTTWRLGSLSVSEGMRIVLQAEAGDWFDLGPPHVGRSAARTLTIVSARQKEAEILSRQTDLLRMLEQAEQDQARTHEQTGDLSVQLDKVGRLKSSDLDVLKRVQSDQRQVGKLLANPTEGAAAAVQGLLSELRQNRVTSPETQRRLERFERDLKEMRDSHLPVIDDEINRAVKTAEIDDRHSNPRAGMEQAKALKGARHGQKLVLESLRSLLGELSQWRSAQALNEEFRELVESQDKLNHETADLSRSTLARPLSELTTQEQTDLARLAERQTRLAEPVERIRQRLRDAATKLRTSNREASDDATALLKLIEQADPESRMREIAPQLAQNNVGQAMDRQHQLLDELRKLNQPASQRPTGDLNSLVQKMDQAGKAIDSLHKDQEALRKKSRDRRDKAKAKPEVAKNLDELRKEQTRLREASEETARELRRLGTEESSERMRQAGSHMAEAEEQLEQGATPSVDGQQEQALKQLEAARRSLEDSQREARNQLARESLVRIADELAALAARQKTIADETKRLDTEHLREARWTRGQLRTLQSTTALQRTLRAEAVQLAGRLENAEVYAWVLGRGAEQMAAAADRLAAQLTDAETINLETDAWTRLNDLVLALKRKSAAKTADPESRESRASQDDGSPRVAGIPELAQLTLLKMLEEGLLRRTDQLDRQRQGSPSALRETTDREIGRLAADQGELARLVEHLAEKVSGKHEAHPEKATGERPKKDSNRSTGAP